MFIVSLRSVYGPGPSQGVHRADGPSYGPGSKWGSMDTGSMFLLVLTHEVSAYTRQAFKLGDDNQEWLLTYISVLHKVY